MASGDPEDFDVQLKDDRVSFYVRTGDGSPYRVYLSPDRAADLAGAIADAMKRCQSKECLRS